MHQVDRPASAQRSEMLPVFLNEIETYLALEPRQGALAAIAAILILFASQAVGQQMHRIGYLGATVLPGPEQALVDVLRTRGYVVGENLEIDFRHHSLPLFLSDAPQGHVGPRPARTA